MTQNQRPKLTLTSAPLQISHRWESAPIKSLLPSLIGFNTFFDVFDKAMAGEIAKVDAYPPRNVIQLDENTWEVQFAVAGFKRENLILTTEGNILIVKGKASDDVSWAAAFAKDEKSAPQYIFRGIGLRDFEHTITFPENATISPTLEDGLLRILITKPISSPTQKVLEIL